MAAEQAQERDFPWQRPLDDARRAGHPRRDRETSGAERRPVRLVEPPEEDHSARVAAGLPFLPKLLRDAAEAIKSAEARVLAAEDQIDDVLAAAEQRVHAAEARAKAAEDLARALEQRANQAIKAAESRADAAQTRADAAEATAKAAEEWITRLRRAMSAPL